MMEAPHREDYRHVIRLAVRWGDMDMLGHVNNARFMTYSESGRIAYFEPLVGADPHGRQAGEGHFILASITCDFLRQLHYPAELEVGTRVTGIGRSSIHLEQGMFDGTRAVARVRSVMVWFDYAAQKTMAVPVSARNYIQGIEGAALRV